MLPEFAFDVCHDIFCAAREIVGVNLPALSLESLSDGLWRPRVRPQMVDFMADFAIAGKRALTPLQSHSRLILFQVFYLGGADYQAARKHVGISETTWSVWTEEIRHRVGCEMLRRKIFPPSRYFLSRSDTLETISGFNLTRSAAKAFAISPAEDAPQPFAA